MEIRAIGVNTQDAAVMKSFGAQSKNLMGRECAGIVRRLGSHVTKFNIGDRVGVMTSFIYANRLITSARRAVRIPD